MKSYLNTMLGQGFELHSQSPSWPQRDLFISGATEIVELCRETAIKAPHFAAYYIIKSLQCDMPMKPIYCPQHFYA